jgi:integrase
MPRAKKGMRVLGPYEEWIGGRIKYRIKIAGIRRVGIPNNYIAESRKEADAKVISLKRVLLGEKLFCDVLVDYRGHLERRIKLQELRPITAQNYLRDAGYFFPADLPLSSMSPRWCQRRYDHLVETTAVATHRNVLKEAKRWAAWATEAGYLVKDPMREVKPVGKIAKGKPTLTRDEATRWLNVALSEAERRSNPRGPVAAVLTLLLAMRTSEVNKRVARDLDGGGRILWIHRAKTPSGNRLLSIPEVLRPHLLRLAAGKGPEDPLFGFGRPDSINRWVHRICELSGVPHRCAHSMRSLHSTLSQVNGVTIDLVAKALGQGDKGVTWQHYTDRGAVEAARVADWQAQLLGNPDGTKRPPIVPADAPQDQSPQNYLPN